MTVSSASSADGNTARSTGSEAASRPTRTLHLANRVSEIRRLADAVERFAAENEVPAKAAHHLNLAADELITNAIEHGENHGHRRIVVTLRRYPDQVVMEIAHRGLAFDPTVEARAPDLDADLDERLVGGLGVHFAKTLLDGLSYVRRRGVNRLTLTKNL